MGSNTFNNFCPKKSSNTKTVQQSRLCNIQFGPTLIWIGPHVIMPFTFIVNGETRLRLLFYAGPRNQRRGKKRKEQGWWWWCWIQLIIGNWKCFCIPKQFWTLHFFHQKEKTLHFRPSFILLLLLKELVLTMLRKKKKNQLPPFSNAHLGTILILVSTFLF